MSLYRQLTISIMVLMLCGFLATVYLNASSLRDLTAAQLETHAQDTATALALSLSARESLSDTAILESMVGAVFDRGSFQRITLTGMDQQVMLEKTVAVNTEPVPAWFIKTFPLPAPGAEALVMSGWQQSATVSVVGNPGKAYLQLWENSTDMVLVYSVLVLILLGTSLVAIRLLLEPLRRLTQQAEAVSAGNYTVLLDLPRTRELRSVIAAMNRMTRKVSEIFTEQSGLVDSLREEAYRDPVTRLGNRRYFDRLTASLPGTDETSSHGALLLLQLHGFSDLNNTSGFEAGDTLLRRTGELVAYQAKQLENCYAARIAGACFAIVAPGLLRESADALAAALCQDLFQLRAEGLVDSNNIGHVGVALWSEQDNPGDLLPAADMALRSAQSSGQNTWQHYTSESANQPLILGEGQWRNVLRDAIEQNSLCLHVQPVMSMTGSKPGCLHLEVLARLPDGMHRHISASVFMPMAERLGLASQIDKQIFSKLLQFMQQGPTSARYFAINLSSTSLQDALFAQWLFSTLEQNQSCARRLLVEFPEYAATRDLQQTRYVMERLVALGCKCGIDHFGRGITSFGYLHSLPLSYVKIDSCYTPGIEDDSNNRFFLQAVTDALHSLDIRVFTQSVASAAERKAYASMNVDGMQGYLTGRPEPLSAARENCSQQD